MKITCNSCGSKYTIADAKVQGKKVKVRCKGCGENILVDGTSSQDPSTEPSDPNATEVADEDQSPAEAPTAAKKGLWSVNLSDDDSRDMTLQELVAAWKAGVVTQDAYVWKDGMGDWKPILEVGELKLKLGPAPKKGAPGVVSSAVPGAKAPRTDKMDDLFGGAGVEGKPEPNKPAMGGAADKATGARNDSSVLFSLDSLNQPAAEANKPQGGAVDIFGGMSGGIGTLGASNVDLLTAPAKDPPPAPAGARLAPTAAAMPIAAPAGKSKTGLFIGAALVAALLIGGTVFALSGSEDGSSEVDEKLKAAEAEAEKARKEAEEAKKKIDEERKKLEEEKKKALAAAKKDDAPKTDDKKEEEEKKEEEAKTGGSTAPSTSSGSSAKPAPAADPAPAASGKPPFDVGAAKAALSAAAANASGCRKPGGPTGSGRVQLTFGTSGRVSSASVVSGPFGGTAVGGCVVSAFRGARVPAFAGTPQTVSKSFSVK